MKLIPLTRGFSAMVDDEDFEWLNSFSWQCKGVDSLYAVGKIYVSGNGKGTVIRMHRMVAYKYWGIPDDKEIDHLDGYPLNNQKANLRIVAHSTNMRNMPTRAPSGFRGVRYREKFGTYQAYIWYNSKQHNLGTFDTAEAAAKAYDATAYKLFGDTFKKYNFPPLKEVQLCGVRPSDSIAA